jgi:hypothetical protein
MSGQVWRARWSGSCVAVKQLISTLLDAKNSHLEFLHEVEMTI